MASTGDYDRSAELIPLSLEHASAVAARLDPPGEVSSLLPMAGGYSSSVYRAELRDGRRVVCRLAMRDRRRWDAELDVMKMAGAVVPVPAVLVRGVHPAVDTVRLAVLEFVDGTTLGQAELQSEADARAAGRAVGAALAAIHSIEFEQAGFFAPGGEVRPLGSEFGLPEMLTSFLRNPVVVERLGDLADAVGSVVAECAHSPRVEGPVVLVHSDFNAKNILMRRTESWDVAAVLDWEFAMAGSGLADIGNFLRFDSTGPPGLVDGFLDEYRRAGGRLPDGFLREAKLLDLVALLEFLSRPNAGDKTISGVRACIEDTATRWGSL